MCNMIMYVSVSTWAPILNVMNDDEARAFIYSESLVKAHAFLFLRQIPRSGIVWILCLTFKKLPKCLPEFTEWGPFPPSG